MVTLTEHLRTRSDCLHQFLKRPNGKDRCSHTEARPQFLAEAFLIAIARLEREDDGPVEVPLFEGVIGLFDEGGIGISTRNNDEHIFCLTINFFLMDKRNNWIEC